MDLFNSIFAALVPSPYYPVTQDADDPDPAKRIQAAADLLAKVADGICADGEKRIFFNGNGNMFGGGPFGGPAIYSLSTGKTFAMPLWMLQRFFNIGSKLKDAKTKQLLLGKLENIQKHLKEEPKTKTKIRAIAS